MRFEYLEASTPEEAVSLLAIYKEKAKIIAGGTDLLLQMKDNKIKPEYIVDISRITGLDYINYNESEGLKIGPLVTIRGLETSLELHKRYPIISQAASQLGSVAIRNVATVGGNLCNALPSAEMAQALIALSARVKIVGPNRTREVLLEDFFTGVGSTVLNKDEILEEILVPVMSPYSKGIFMKHSMRGTIDLAIVNFGIVITHEDGDIDSCKDIRIVIGAVGPRPLRAYKAEEILRGKAIHMDLINKVAQMASNEVHPRAGSIRGSIEYKKDMIKVFVRNLIKKAIDN